MEVITMTEMRRILASSVERAGGVRAFARNLDRVSHSSLSMMLRGDRPISPIVANKIGLILETTGRRIVDA
jgi:hypothetical protein